MGGGGLAFQIVLGFALAGSGNATSGWMIFPHMLIGISGIALVAFLVSTIFLMPSSMLARVVYSVAFVLTFAQAALGFRILAFPDDMLLMAHEGLALLVLALLGVGGILTARARRTAMTT